MSQALKCGCRPDSLITEECCPWHPEFSTGITHSSSLFPALGSSSRREQTRRGNPLSPSPCSSHCPRPLPHHILFLILFITFPFPSISWGQLMQLILFFLSVGLCQSGSGVTQAHDSQSESDQFRLIAEEMVVDQEERCLSRTGTGKHTHTCTRTHTHTHTHIMHTYS